MSRHPTDFLSLAFGLLFVAIGLVMIAGVERGISLAWVAPLAAIVLGVLVALAARPLRTGPEDVPSED